MPTNKVIGFRVVNIDSGRYVNHDGDGYHWLSSEDSVPPEPISRDDRRERPGDGIMSASRAPHGYAIILDSGEIVSLHDTVPELLYGRGDKSPAPLSYLPLGDK